jgi:hypothetical protein
MGLIILSGLPNSTSVHQEMDALYGPFKSAIYACGESILIEKIKDRGMRRATGGAAQGASSILSLGFDDLATIVNGNENDELSMKPFDKSFTEEKILKAWTKIGFVLFTRHELGQANVNEDLENLQVSYSEVVALAEKVGINPGIFDSEIPVAQHLNRAIDEDEQEVRKLLVAERGGLTACSMWKHCGTRIGNSRLALRAQRELIAIDEAKNSLVTQNRLGRQTKLLENAQHALAKYRTQGSSTLTNKDWGDIVRWVLPEAKVPGLMRDLKNRDTIIAKLATLERDWTTYIPSPPSIEMSTPILTIDLVMLRVFGLKYSIMLYDNVTFFTACIVVKIYFAHVSC